MIFALVRDRQELLDNRIDAASALDLEFNTANSLFQIIGHDRLMTRGGGAPLDNDARALARLDGVLRVWLKVHFADDPSHTTSYYQVR